MNSARVERKPNQLRILFSNLFGTIDKDVETKKIEEELAMVLKVEEETGGTENIRKLEGRMSKFGITEKDKTSKRTNVVSKEPHIRNEILHKKEKTTQRNIKEQDQLEI